MLNRIKSIVRENRLRQKQILAQSRELEWAEVFHDSIRGKPFLENLPLNVGRWAGNYSFFYLLNRILADYKPASILEMGLGESSKFISAYLTGYLPESRHIIIEHDETWTDSFRERFVLSERSEIRHFPLETAAIENHKSFVYKNFGEAIGEKFDLYVVDGPPGSDRFSRYDIVGEVRKFDPQDEFVIILDDYDRPGEKDTAEKLLEELRSKQIPHFVKTYSGRKNQFLIATSKYRRAATL
jgi:hypothetical protein